MGIGERGSELGAGSWSCSRPPREVSLRRVRSLRGPDLSARVAEEQGERGGFREAIRDQGGPSRRWSTALPDILAGADFKAVVAALRAARDAGGRHHLGPRRARDQDRPVAGADRSDGARLRVGARDERRRHHSRLRAGAVGLDLGGRRRGARSRAIRHGGGNRHAARMPRSTRASARGLGLGQAVAANLHARRSRRTPTSASCARRRGSRSP